MSKINEKKADVTQQVDVMTEALKEVAKFKETLKDLSEKELLDLEQKIIKEADDHAEARNKKTFLMPAKNYKDAMLAIRESLDTISVNWQYALGLKNMYEFFDPDNYKEKVPYPLLDSMLRTLGQANLKGYKQWNNVVVISEYFESIREDYAKTSAEVYVDAERHNMIVDALKLYQAKTEVIESAKAN